LVVAVILVLAYALIWSFAPLMQPWLPRTEDRPLELPEELLLTRMANVPDWQADPLHGGFLLVTNEAEGKSDRDFSIERINPPWRTRTIETPPTKVPRGHGALDMLPISLSHDGRYLVMPTWRPPGQNANVRSGLALEIWDRDHSEP
jgi:hypothetical protein